MAGKEVKYLIILITAFLLIGCSSFRYYDRLQECDKLLDRSKIQIQQAVVIIDSLMVESAKIDSLKQELIKCQQ